jgi:hypothetical protein
MSYELLSGTRPEAWTPTLQEEIKSPETIQFAVGRSAFNLYRNKKSRLSTDPANSFRPWRDKLSTSTKNNGGLEP